MGSTEIDRDEVLSDHDEEAVALTVDATPIDSEENTPDPETTIPPPADELLQEDSDKSHQAEDQHEDETKGAAQPPPKSSMQALEIDDNDEENPLDISQDPEDLDEDDDNDMEGLLTQKAPKSAKAPTTSSTTGCCSSHKIGNTTVFWPSRYQSTKWGMMGPHWFGPPVVLTLLWAASWYFIHHSWLRVGPITATICVGWASLATFYLSDTCYRDPGIVIPQDEDFLGAPGSGSNNKNQRPPPPSRQHRWCDICQTYQPPTGAHCPECNVCVSGYDHHCAWMGCCIGEGNYKSFMKFNMTWMVFLSYSIFWVSMLGPLCFRHSSWVKDHHDHHPAMEPEVTAGEVEGSGE